MWIPKTKYISEKRKRQLTRDSNGEEYQKWRKEVLQRDGHKCQWPGCNITKELEVHHIRKFADNKHLKTAVFNGISLCKKHHRGIHSKEEMYELLFSKIVEDQIKKNAEKENRKN